MPRSTSPTLTDAELRLMKILWSRGRASVREVTDQLPADRAVAYNTVQTLLGILEKKGYVEREREGRAFVYLPLVTRAAARTEALRHVLGSFFAGSPRELVHSLLDEQLDDEQLAEVRELLDRAAGQESTSDE